MIVSDEKRFIYARIPKTASTSVSAALEPYRRKADRSLLSRIGRRIAPSSGHPALVDFRAHSHWGLQSAREVLGEAFFASSFRFSVVRHPIARARSLYAHIMRHSSEPKFQSVYATLYESCSRTDDSSLDPFVDWLLENPLPPQASLLVDYEGNLLANAVVRVENLDSEIAPIFKSLGINAQIPTLNVGDSRARGVVSDAARSSLRDIFSIDFALFGYGNGDGEIDSEPQMLRGMQTRDLGKVLAQAGGARNFTPWEPIRRV